MEVVAGRSSGRLLERNLRRTIVCAIIFCQRIDFFLWHDAILAALHGPVEASVRRIGLDTMTSAKMTYEADDALSKSLVTVRKRIALNQGVLVNFID